MKYIINKCDKCKLEFNEIKTFLRSDNSEFDLCNKCTKILKNIIDQWLVVKLEEIAC
jgi:hypothetical protein